MAGFMLSYSYSRKQASERPCSHLELSPHTHTHTHTHTCTHTDAGWKRHMDVSFALSSVTNMCLHSKNVC